MNPLGLDPRRFIIAVPASAGTGSPAESGLGPAASWGARRNTPVVVVAGMVQAVPLETREEGSASATTAAAAETARPPRMELRSLVVAAEHRRRGLGSLLVERQLAELPPGSEVWLSTLLPTEAFYTRLGFTRRGLLEVPSEMRFTVAAGVLAARLLANSQLIVMSTTLPPP